MGGGRPLGKRWKDWVARGISQDSSLALGMAKRNREKKPGISGRVITTGTGKEHKKRTDASFVLWRREERMEKKNLRWSIALSMKESDLKNLCREQGNRRCRTEKKTKKKKRSA